MDDFELDAETLRQIEEEALRQVEEDFELDPETMREIEQAALQEAGLLDVDLGEQTLNDISVDTMREMREKKAAAAAASAPAPTPAAAPAAPPTPSAPAAPATPPPPPTPAAPAAPTAPVAPAAPTPPAAVPPPAAAPAPAPDSLPAPGPATAAEPAISPVEPSIAAAPAALAAAAAAAPEAAPKGEKAVQEARKEAYDKARREAITKAKRTAADKAKQVASKRRHAMPAASPNLAAMETQPKGGKTIFIVIGVCVVLLFAVIIVVAKMAQPKPRENTSLPIAGEVQKTPEQIAQAEFDKLRRSMSAMERGSSTGEELKEIVSQIETFQATYPDFAAQDAVSGLLDKRLAKYKGFLKNLYTPADGQAPAPEPAPAP